MYIDSLSHPLQKYGLIICSWLVAVRAFVHFAGNLGSNLSVWDNLIFYRNFHHHNVYQWAKKWKKQDPIIALQMKGQHGSYTCKLGWDWEYMSTGFIKVVML